MRLLTCAFAALVVTTLLCGPARGDAVEIKEYGLSVFKLGEVNATDDMAKQAIDSLCGYLDRKIDGAHFVRRGVRNAPADALKLLQDDKKQTAVAIISAGFYFAHKDDLKLTVLAEARRGGFDGEQFSLRGESKQDTYPEGKVVATSLDGDADWLNKVVMPCPAGKKPVTWKHYDNLFDAGFAMIDDEGDAPDFILLDRVSAAAFDKDGDLKGLPSGWQSALLPQDLVVELDARLGDRRDKLKDVLAKLDKDDEGKKVGETLQTATFPAPDDKRLAAAEKAFKG